MSLESEMLVIDNFRKFLTVWVVPVDVFEESGDDEDDGGEEDEEEGDEGADPGTPTQARVFKQVPPPRKMEE